MMDQLILVDLFFIRWFFFPFFLFVKIWVFSFSTFGDNDSEFASFFFIFLHILLVAFLIEIVSSCGKLIDNGFGSGGGVDLYLVIWDS